jgi:short-subunit dehydrogenase
VDLRDRVVLLTGASRGIGAAIAVALAREGARLVLTARDEAGLAEVAERVRAAGGRARTVPADVGTDEGRATILAATAAEGPLAVFIGNAGIEIPVAVVDQTAAQIEKQIRVNLTSPLLLTHAVLPGMIERGLGAVVLVSSMSGKSPTPYNAIYTATKHALNGFVASLRIELRETPVTAGVVCPSFVADAGMWNHTGLRAPRAMREVPLQSVVAAVRRAIDRGGEHLVTPGPIRPLLAIKELFPGLDATVLRALGVLDTLEKRALTTREHGARE